MSHKHMLFSSLWSPLSSPAVCAPSLWSSFFFTNSICVTMLQTHCRHIWAHMTIQQRWSGVPFWLTGSRKEFLFLSPRQTAGFVYQRQTDGQKLPQRHTPHRLASSLTATAVRYMPKLTVWAKGSCTTEMKWESKRGCCGFFMLRFHHNTCKTSNVKCRLYERKSICRLHRPRLIK